MAWYWWMLNDDEPTPPAWFRPGEHEQVRMIAWLGRNFAHNLMWYVIGLKGKEYKSYGLYPNENWNPNGGYNFVVHKYEWLFFPFISYKGKTIECYAGWRQGGALGFAFRRRIG